MGTGLEDQITTLEHAYGLDGLSLTDLRALFTQTTLGKELTPAQQAMNDHIQQIVDLIYKLPVAATAPGAAPDTGGTSTSGLASTSSTPSPVNFNTGVTPANGNTTPIIVMDGNVIVQVMLDQNQMANGTTIGLEASKALQAFLYRRLSLQMGMSGSLAPVGS